MTLANLHTDKIKNIYVSVNGSRSEQLTSSLIKVFSNRKIKEIHINGSIVFVILEE